MRIGKWVIDARPPHDVTPRVRAQCTNHVRSSITCWSRTKASPMANTKLSRTNLSFADLICFSLLSIPRAKAHLSATFHVVTLRTTTVFRATTHRGCVVERRAHTCTKTKKRNATYIMVGWKMMRHRSHAAGENEGLQDLRCGSEKESRCIVFFAQRHHRERNKTALRGNV